jgi:hypothetical protein
MMNRRVWLILALASSPISAAEIFKWKDENGIVHYGYSVPERYRNTATRVHTLPGPTDAQRREAEDRWAQDRARTKPQQAAATGPSQSSSGLPRSAESCEEQKRRYEASQLCFHPYRNATGGIKAEAFQHCVEVKEPRC